MTSSDLPRSSYLPTTMRRDDMRCTIRDIHYMSCPAVYGVPFLPLLRVHSFFPPWDPSISR